MNISCDTSPPNRLLSAGSNSHGQLAHGTCEDARRFTPCIFEDPISGARQSNLPLHTHAISKIVGGGNHTLLLLDVNVPTEATTRREVQLWACGDRRAGQLDFADSSFGTSNATSWTVFSRPSMSVSSQAGGTVVKDVAAAWETSYLVSSCDDGDDRVFSFGSNAFGALGVLDESRTTRRKALVDFRSLFPEAQGGVITVAAIASGPRHVIVILNLAEPSRPIRTIVAGWGACRHGELGTIPPTPAGRAMAIQPTPLRIKLADDTNDPAVSVACGNQHTLILHASGRVTTLGSDRFGQTSAPREWAPTTRVACTWNGSYTVVGSSSHSVLAAGSNTHGQLGVLDVSAATTEVCVCGGTQNCIIHDMACGSEHVLCLSGHITDSTDRARATDRWSLHGWGWNEHGNIGLGNADTDDVRGPVHIPLGPAQWPLRVWAGCGNSWVVVHETDA